MSTKLEDLLTEWENPTGAPRNNAQANRAIQRKECARQVREATRPIPVSERLPDPGRYLVRAPDPDYADGWAWRTDDWDGTGWCFAGPVTHWLELPGEPA